MLEKIIVVHCGSIRQTASILSMSQDCLRTGDKALVHFRFIKHPEYIKPGQRMVFREGRTKAVGNVVKLIPHSNNTTTQTSRINKPHKTSQNTRQNTNMQVYLHNMVYKIEIIAFNIFHLSLYK